MSTEKPQRIQLSRKKGWRMPPNTVKVTRPGKWGNRFVVSKWDSAEECVASYVKVLSGNVWSEPNIGSIQAELKGKNLACWCKLGAPCHGTVLLAIANMDYASARKLLMKSPADVLLEIANEGGKEGAR